ncbi:MAG TPA: HD domain-containing phosphohydrolase [Syntrophomonas sp.]|nr:HD domain-containing phosphohydrolase [Syntrophomonas sp.]
MNTDLTLVQQKLLDAIKTYPNEAALQLLLEDFAARIENKIQNRLMTDLMLKYAELSQKLEATNLFLAQSETRLREAQQIALLGHWELDVATRDLRWSDTMYQILQIDPAQKPHYELFMQRVHPEDCDMVAIHYRQLPVSVEPNELRYRLLMPDNQLKWVHIKATAHFDADGKILAARGTIQDITIMKLTEEQLQKFNHHLQELVDEKVQEISESQMATIFALVKLSESRDDETGNHIERTASLCRLMAERMGLLSRYAGRVNDEFIDNIYHASPLHDIGKVGIPDAILLKPGRLTPEEFEIMKTHTTIGFNTLAQVEQRYTQNTFLQMGMDIAIGHHEKWDGSGYPQGLAGEDIPLAARIMAIVDVYDALRSKRVYKEAFSHEKSRAIIAEGAGSHFDPYLVELFMQIHQEFEIVRDSL